MTRSHPLNARLGKGVRVGHNGPMTFSKDGARLLSGAEDHGLAQGSGGFISLWRGVHTSILPGSARCAPARSRPLSRPVRSRRCQRTFRRARSRRSAPRRPAARGRADEPLGGAHDLLAAAAAAESAQFQSTPRLAPTADVELFAVEAVGSAEFVVLVGEVRRPHVGHERCAGRCGRRWTRRLTPRRASGTRRRSAGQCHRCGGGFPPQPRRRTLLPSRNGSQATDPVRRGRRQDRGRRRVVVAQERVPRPLTGIGDGVASAR